MEASYIYCYIMIMMINSNCSYFDDVPRIFPTPLKKKKKKKKERKNRLEKIKLVTESGKGNVTKIHINGWSLNILIWEELTQQKEFVSKIMVHNATNIQTFDFLKNRIHLIKAFYKLLSY